MANQGMLETAAIWGGLSLWLLILWGGLHFVLGYVGRCSRKRSSSPSKPFVVEGKAVHRKSATPWVSCWETIKGCIFTVRPLVITQSGLLNCYAKRVKNTHGARRLYSVRGL